MQKGPPPFVWAVPDEKNILTWNFLIRGPPDSPFAGGEYHGVLLFPAEYPFKPPGIKMYTPSGRFHPDKKICFSMSDFHPGSWNPAWSVATILTGLLSFMLSDEITTGSITSSESHKRVFAARSHPWNIGQNRFKEAFPEYCGPRLQDLPNMGEKERGKPATPPPNPVSLFSIPPASSSLASSSGVKPLTSAVIRPHKTIPAIIPIPSASGKPEEGGGGWAATWRQMMWEKWRWGVLIAVALVVSRFSSSV